MKKCKQWQEKVYCFVAFFLLLVFGIIYYVKRAMKRLIVFKTLMGINLATPAPKEKIHTKINFNIFLRISFSCFPFHSSCSNNKATGFPRLFVSLPQRFVRILLTWSPAIYTLSTSHV